MNNQEPSANSQTRLESWKEIGAYLQRDATTARRWEKEEGLPVHRHSHKSRSSVYAYPSEIDAWRATRKVAPEPASPRPVWRLPAFALTKALCLVMVGNGVRPVAAQGGPIARQVCTDCGDAYLGYDGRYLLFTDWNRGDLAIRDLISGQVKYLQTGATKDSHAWAWLSVMSPDSRQVAYLWEPYEKPNRDFQLRVIANENGAKPRVLMASPEDTYYKPFGWSADNKWVFVVVEKRGDGTWQIVRVSVDDGSVVTLKSLQWRFRGFNDNYLARVSPDGRYIAYSALALNPSKRTGAPTDPQDQHIYILAADGSSESEVVKTSGLNSSLVWTSDGKHILFLSNRSGGRGLWSIPIENGKATASPSLLSLNLGSGAVWPIGMTRSGSYYYGQWTGDVEQIAVADLRGGKPVETFVGTNPSWSPDGKSIAFKRHRPGSEGVNEYDLVVHSVERGDEKTFPATFGATGNGQPTWFHDNKGIPIGPGSFLGSYRIDLERSEWKQIPQVLRGGVLSLDDKTLYAAHPQSVVAVDFATGTERKVASVPFMSEPDFPKTALSPDGHTLAFWSPDQARGKVRLSTVGVDGTNFRELASFEESRKRGYLTWSGDGQAVLAALKAADKWQILRFPLQGGQAESTGIETAATIQAFSLNPDGSRIVYSSVKEQKDSLWALDNVLSSLK